MKYLFYFLRPVIFYLLLFAFYRLAFLVLYVLPVEDIHFSELLLAFVYGSRLDLAVASYILVLPLVLWILSFRRADAFLNKVIRGYHIFVIALINLESFANLLVYKYWDSLLNWRALSYLDDPKEAAASASGWMLLVLFLLLVVAIVFSVRIFFRKFFQKPTAPSSITGRLILTVLFSSLWLLAVRGGWQLLPVNESVAYFSSVKQLNDAATNSLWHLGHSAKAATSKENPFHNMDDKEAQTVVDSLYVSASKDSSAAQLLLKKDPNIVLIILESFSSDLLGCMGARQSSTPFLDSLSAQGILFTSIYSSGFRTDQGLPSLLSGFPATPIFSVIRYPEKSAALPSLVKELQKKNYRSSYYYGGAGNFRNMKAYCFNLGFEKFTDKSDYSADLPQSKWGVHDEYVLMRQAQELSNVKQPFFSVVMTLSNHEPYDVPMKAHFPISDDVSKFRNSAYYTDASLKKYFQYAKTQKWFENTLFIFVADHGHHYPEKRPMSGPEAHHLPLLFFGQVLAPEAAGKKTVTIGNHHDLPATLLGLLQMDHKDFRWSKDLLDGDSKSFAYYEQEDGFGWIEKEGWIYYSVLQKKEILKSDSLANEPVLIRRGSAYVQQLYEEFLRF